MSCQGSRRREPVYSHRFCRFARRIRFHLGFDFSRWLALDPANKKACRDGFGFG
jgi:hypothetical protein